MQENVVAKLVGIQAPADKASIIEAIHHFSHPEYIDADKTGKCLLRFLNEEHFEAFMQKVKEGKLVMNLVNKGTKFLQAGIKGENPPGLNN